jgi:lactoylglutathione lyase
MKFLHAMLRVSDPAATVAFFTHLGLEERRRIEVPAGKYTLIFLGAPGDDGGEVELTHNWDESGYVGGRNFGHLAYRVDDIYAFVRSPDGISIELLQAGENLAPAEPWASMPNTGEW